MDCWDVHRRSQGSLQWHVGTTCRAIVVMWLPVANAYWCTADGCIRRHTPLNCCGVDKRFEAGTSLSICLSRIVELVRVEVVTPHHCHNFTSLRVKSHHRALHGRNLRELNL